MNEARWILLSLALLAGSCIAWPFVSGSPDADGSLWCFSVAGFAAGAMFRGVIDGPRREERRVVRDDWEDAWDDARVRVYRPLNNEFDDDEWGG
jgi:hypothetical protein